MEKTQQPCIFLLPPDSSIRLNFQTYHFNESSAVFIQKGQYVSLKPRHSLAVEDRSTHEFRYLFSQLLSVGHIHADNDLVSDNQNETLRSAQEKWIEMNPFKATQEELSILFDLNDWLEHNVTAKMESPFSFLSYQDVQQISKEKLQLTFFQWKNHKLISHARRSLFETNGSVKEAAYLLGFKDPAYFSRFFKNQTSITPGQFVDGLEHFSRNEALFEAFREAMDLHIERSHQVTFYANLLSQTPRTFSRNIYQSTGQTPKEHITNRLINSAKKMLDARESVTTTAFALGFAEISHFSAFFKLRMGKTPSEYLSESTRE